MIFDNSNVNNDKTNKIKLTFFQKYGSAGAMSITTFLTQWQCFFFVFVMYVHFVYIWSCHIVNNIYNFNFKSYRQNNPLCSLIPCSDRHFYCVNLNKCHYWEQYFISNFNIEKNFKYSTVISMFSEHINMFRTLSIDIWQLKCKQRQNK